MAISGTFMPVPQLVLLIQKSPFDFYLTGSRAFGKENMSSDWDFFTQDCVAVRNFLMENEFYTQHGSYIIGDPFSVVVMAKGVVHVQLVADVGTKILAQELVSNWPGYLTSPPDKVADKVIWRTCHDFIHRVRQYDLKTGLSQIKITIPTPPTPKEVNKRKIEWQGE